MATGGGHEPFGADLLSRKHMVEVMADGRAQHGRNSRVKRRIGRDASIVDAGLRRKSLDVGQAFPQMGGERKSVGKVLEVGGKRKEREELVATLTNGSKGAVEWLVDEKGVDLSVVALLGGHSFPRTHRGAGQTPPGASIVTTLLKSLKGHENFGLETECQVIKVLKEKGVVTGVEYVCKDDKDVKTALGPVVFATGGFAGDAFGYLAKYRPDLAGFPSTNDVRAGTQGLLTNVGGQVIDMDQVQVHPTAFVDPKDPLSPQKFLAAELLRGEGGLLLHKGKRFINEMETRKKVTDKITTFPTSTPDGKAKQWDVDLVMDEAAYLASKSHVDFYLWKGLMRKTTASDLGPEGLETLKEFAAFAKGEKKDELKRHSFGHWALDKVTGESVIYTGKVTPAVHFTMGGALISKAAEVVDQDGAPIKGLWAAGEVTGGVHGENRLGGSSLLECVVFGRLAGEGATKFIQGK